MAAASLGGTHGTVPDQKCDILLIPDAVLGVGEAMRRREFITLLGGAPIIWPLAAHTQQAGKPPLIGFLGATTPALASERVAAFTQRLQELGWIEDRAVKIEYRWAEGDLRRLGTSLAEASIVKA